MLEKPGLVLYFRLLDVVEITFLPFINEGVSCGDMMKRVGWVYHPIYLQHETGEYHPETKERLESIVKRLKKDELDSQIVHVDPYEASVDWIKEVHAPAYIDRVKSACEQGLPYLDTDDCPISPKTYEAALWAVGGVLAAADKIMAEDIDRAFCAVRPPGHHAEWAQSMGFCYFNNVAIGARYLQKKYNLKKIFILDWDVHHGNGTQHIFETDPSVFYCSLHEDPRSCFPGTGYAEEMGVGEGFNFTLNYPMPVFSKDDAYYTLFISEIAPVMRRFQPDFILISAGFDAHKDDDLAYIELTEEGYRKMTQQVVDLADEICDGRIISVLEGGYNLKALGKCVSEHIKTLMGRE